MLKTFIAAALLAVTVLAPGAQLRAETGPALLAVESENDFETTLARLLEALDARGMTTFAVIDHAKGAASIGESLRPTTLIVFGNPRGGTPLMQAEQRMGIELPLKMLVAEKDGGAVTLFYPEMDKILDKYGVTGQDKRLTAISAALDAIAADAAAQ